jgi:Tol biopolymer transport system component/DNA-binding winged helix-turn-helix (wHTH) protein
MSHPQQHIYKFGHFRLDVAERLLLRDGEVVPLQPKVFDLLLALVARHGRLVEKEELMTAVWPDTFVEEANIASNISILRKILSENGERLIETVPKRGYRFVAEVCELTDEKDRPSIRSNGAGLTINGVDESINAAAAALDRATAPDGEPGGEAHRRMKRLRLLNYKLMLALAALGVLLVTAGGLLGWYFRPEGAAPIKLAVPLTSYHGFERNPALSPDGNQVAFSWDGEKQDNFDIYIKLIGSSSHLRLTTNPAEDLRPVWSPDGRTIAFLRRLERDRNELMLIPSLGGPERKLTETLIVDYTNERLPSLAWAPDGHWLVVSHREGNDIAECLFLVSARTGEKRRLTRPLPNFNGDFKPAFSPNGHTLAFSRLRGLYGSELYLLSLREDYEPAGEARRLQTGEGWADNPAWTRDGLHILYIATAIDKVSGKPRELRMIAVSGGGKPERLTPIEGAISEISLGRHLVYTRSASDVDIWRAEIPPPGGQAARPRLFISSTRYDNLPQYSPDGKKIAFNSTRSGSQEIWIADADGSNAFQLTSFGGPLVGYKDWSPDSQWIVFHARPEGQSDLFIIPAGGGAPKRITADPTDDILPSFSRDGRWIYFMSTRSGQVEVWKMPAEGGDAVQITTEGGRMPFESPDGKTLYFTRLSREKGIWKMPVQGGEASQVTGPVNDFSYVGAAEGIFYSAPPDSRRRGLIQFLSFSTGRIRTVVETDRPIAAGLSLSPDKRFLVCAQHNQVGSDLMLIENFVAR